MLVTASREEGVLEEEEQTMLHKVFEFADKDAADVMVPRPDMVALTIEMPVAELLRLMLQHPYTRYPVYEDEVDNVLGILHVRDLFAALHDHGIERRRRARRWCGRRSWCPRRSGWTSCWPSSGHLEPHGDRGRRVRVGGRAGHARGPAGGDRRRDRRRVRPAQRGRAPAGRGTGAGGRVVPDRGVQRAVRDAPFPTRLPQRGRLRLRRAGPGAAGGRRGRTDGVRFEVSAVDGSRIIEVDATLGPAEAASEQASG